MDRRGFFVISIFCLLIALALASGSNSREPSLLTTLQAGNWARNKSGSSDVGQQEVVGGHDTRSRSERERIERTDNQSRVEQEEEAEDYEGEAEDKNENEDDYEDELKAVAESHEAMSRDDTRNSNASTAPSTILLDVASPAKNFHSHEVIAVNDSDEYESSNEAITDEIIDKYDQEVAELLKYKKEGNSNHSEANRSKTKRVPTVKKELSTQKEILIGSNETQVPKSLLPPEDTVNRLNEETEAIRRRNVATSGIKLKDSEGLAGAAEVAVDNRYSEPGLESSKKLNKRQETILKDLKSYLLAEYETEEEQRQKLRQLKAKEDALAKNLLKLLVKLAENPSRWECVQKLLSSADNEASPRDSDKNDYETTSKLFSVTPRSIDDSIEPRNRLRKKKKKQKHRFSTTTLTPVPATPPLLTTTETPWQTTPVQWRLIAERLFGPPWQKDLQDLQDLQQLEKTTTGRHTVSQSPTILLPSIRDLIERDESKSSNPKHYGSDRKATITEEVDEVGDQRVARFGKVARVQSHRDILNPYDKPSELERDVADYDDQMLPESRDFLRRHEDDYQTDSNAQADGYVHDQDYEAQGRDYPLSKSWPDIMGYNAPWKVEDRSPLPMGFEKWPWRQTQDAPMYWSQRNPYSLVEKSYWSNFRNEDDPEEEAENEKPWQEQRARHSWGEREERPSKASVRWQESARAAKLYDRDQSNGIWEKSKNRSELSRSSTKQESKEKVVLPQITMKTWNSLTSDPATWPQKLPGAKPWPKDENGKSYNPNADLVKKLGLDKQNGATWSKEDVENSNADRKTKDSKKEDSMPRTEVSKYKSNDERSNFSDYKARSSESVKPWTMLDKGHKDWAKSDNMQTDDSSIWRRKYESKNSWSNEVGLPKIQSVNAWVMTGDDQSTWKPYQMKPIEPSEEVTSRRWSKPRSNGNAKWNKGSWTEKMNDSWMDRSNAELWPGKGNKPGSWFAKSKDTDGWTSKSNNPDSLKVKGDWLSKSESPSWTSRGNGASWSTKPNESWTSKADNDLSKFNGDSWSTKNKEEDTGNTWSRKNNNLPPWQQKMNDEWRYGKSSSPGVVWPGKWKQFVYHRVTAMPISKPGTTSDTASSKSKNAFVAVSAVSSPKYSGSEWRKNEEETNRNENGRQEERERSGNDIRMKMERPIYAWKKDPGTRTKGNATDPLENQLEALKQIDLWSFKGNQAEKRSTSTGATTETTSTIPSNATSSTMQRRAGVALGNGIGSGNSKGNVNGNGNMNGNGLLETNRRTISMK